MFLAYKGRTAEMHSNRIIPYRGINEYWSYAKQQKLQNKVSYFMLWLGLFVHCVVGDFLSI